MAKSMGGKSAEKAREHYEERHTVKGAIKKYGKDVVKGAKMGAGLIKHIVKQGPRQIAREIIDSQERAIGHRSEKREGASRTKAVKAKAKAESAAKKK